MASGGIDGGDTERGCFNHQWIRVTLGNAGQEQTKAAAVKVTPVIQVTEPGDVTDSNISAMNSRYDETI
ncbi:hypothetical protein O9993_15235 [Vibrio lentus]|nr:hypothetical protein [Vibrio lentus]